MGRWSRFWSSPRLLSHFWRPSWHIRSATPIPCIMRIVVCGSCSQWCYLCRSSWGSLISCCCCYCYSFFYIGFFVESCRGFVHIFSLYVWIFQAIVVASVGWFYFSCLNILLLPYHESFKFFVCLLLPAGRGIFFVSRWTSNCTSCMVRTWWIVQPCCGIDWRWTCYSVANVLEGWTFVNLRWIFSFFTICLIFPRGRFVMYSSSLLAFSFSNIELVSIKSFGNSNPFSNSLFISCTESCSPLRAYAPDQIFVWIVQSSLHSCQRSWVFLPRSPPLPLFHCFWTDVNVLFHLCIFLF